MARLGDVLSITSGGTPDKRNPLYYTGGTIPWVKTGDLKDQYVHSNVECITELGLKNSSAKIFPKGTVLVAMYGATIGACSILPFAASTNQACAAFLPQEGISPKYLYYFLCSKADQFVKAGVGGAQPNISAGYLKEVEFSLLPEKEQNKIVAVLDRISNMIALRQQQLAKLDELVKARFVEMFGANTKRDCVSLESICSIITDGTHQPPKFTSTGIPFLFVSNLVTNQITYNTEKHISEETYAELIKRTPIEKGDILLSTVGSFGHPAIVQSDRKFCFQRHIAYLKPIHKTVNSGFLYGALLSDDVQAQIEGKVKGIAQKTLNLSEIRALRVPLPSMEKQVEFASLLEKVQETRLTIQRGLDKMEMLKKALMQEYFG